MLKKEITYKDLDENDVTETFYFNLNKAELAEMALSKEGKKGGLDVWIRDLINSQDGEVLVATFKEILLSTIGERSEDNKRFIKSEQIRNNFLHSDAYSVLFMELMTDAEKMAAFINGVVPAAMREELAKEIENTPDLAAFKGPEERVEEKTINATPEPKDDRPEWMKDPNRIPTEAELKGATSDQMMEAFRRKSAPVPEQPRQAS